VFIRIAGVLPFDAIAEAAVSIYWKPPLRFTI
jgi:hypothetical protein